MALTPTHAQLHTERAARCVVADNGKHRERQLNKSLAAQAKTKQCQQQCNMNMNGVRLCTAHTHTINRFTFVTTHKVQIQIVVSFGCLHFECCGSGCACCHSLLLCAVHIAPIWMLLPVPFGKSTSFGLVWAYLGPVVCAHCSYIYIYVYCVGSRAHDCISCSPICTIIPDAEEHFCAEYFLSFHRYSFGFCFSTDFFSLHFVSTDNFFLVFNCCCFFCADRLIRDLKINNLFILMKNPK